MRLFNWFKQDVEEYSLFKYDNEVYFIRCNEDYRGGYGSLHIHIIHIVSDKENYIRNCVEVYNAKWIDNKYKFYPHIMQQIKNDFNKEEL